MQWVVYTHTRTLTHSFSLWKIHHSCQVSSHAEPDSNLPEALWSPMMKHPKCSPSLRHQPERKNTKTSLQRQNYECQGLHLTTFQATYRSVFVTMPKTICKPTAGSQWLPLSHRGYVPKVQWLSKTSDSIMFVHTNGQGVHTPWIHWTKAWFLSGWGWRKVSSCYSKWRVIQNVRIVHFI